MAENAIDLVRQAETHADDTLNAAAKKAAAITRKARQDAQELLEVAQGAAQDDAAKALAAAHAESAKELEDMQVSLNEDMDELASKARSAQPKAVQMILDALAKQ